MAQHKFRGIHEMEVVRWDEPWEDVGRVEMDLMTRAEAVTSHLCNFKRLSVLSNPLIFRV